MTITKIIDKSKLPNQSQDQATFDAFFAQLLLDLVDWGMQVNAETAAMNAAIASFNGALAGNAYAIPYTVDLSSTADADPGAGKLRFNSATQSAATVLRADLVGADTADYTKSLDTFDASTSTIKGTIRIVKVGDARKFLVFNVTARSSLTGYRNITVTPADFSAASPFIHDEQVLLFFQRTGDKGDKGNQGDPGTLLAPTIHVRDERASGANGGSISSGMAWVTRALLAVKLNTITGASLASSRVTLPAGTYEFDGSAPVWGVGMHQARLYNVTDSVAVATGTSEFASDLTNGNGFYPSSRSFLRGRFTVAASKVFELQHLAQSAGAARSAGQPSSTGEVEVYSEVIFRKVA